MSDQPITIDQLSEWSKNSLQGNLGVEFIEAREGFIQAKMPVDHRTIQPFGLLHGGASVALAETLGSFGSLLLLDQTKQFCVGLEINANHLRSAKSGWVTGTATIIHQGKKTHVWDIRITNEEGELVCISRLTVAILDKKA
jgi:1,4-dihydroxy-2-naphthoyl-CoA hydrolase